MEAQSTIGQDWQAFRILDEGIGVGEKVIASVVLLVITLLTTLGPVITARYSLNNAFSVNFYESAKYFGSGVIIGTAFVHLLDPAYSLIGPQSELASHGGIWSKYSFVPVIVMAAIFATFVADFLFEEGSHDEEGFEIHHQHLQPSDAESVNEITRLLDNNTEAVVRRRKSSNNLDVRHYDCAGNESNLDPEELYKRKFYSFLKLDIGVLFHSVLIGINLGVITQRHVFIALYMAICVHQAFEGLGLGARAIELINNSHPYVGMIFAIGYSLCTPGAALVGIFLSNTAYSPDSDTARIVSGVLNSISAGILIYTGLVELMARDFFFDPNRPRGIVQRLSMLISMLLGACVMSLLGIWV